MAESNHLRLVLRRELPPLFRLVLGHPRSSHVASSFLSKKTGEGQFSVQGGRLRFTERSGVTGWDELFSNEVTLIFRDTTGSDLASVQAVVARSQPVLGTAVLDLEGAASRDDLALLIDAMRGGDFHVAVRGPTALDGGEDFSVSLGISLWVAAYCD